MDNKKICVDNKKYLAVVVVVVVVCVIFYYLCMYTILSLGVHAYFNLMQSALADGQRMD